MSNQSDGGPAFPYESSTRDGMSLRDYFAAKAMQGRLAVPGAVDFAYDAEFAYQMADAMLAERSKRP